MGLSVVVATGDLGKTATGGLTILVLLGLLAMGIPVGFAMILAAVVAMIGIRDVQLAESSLQSITFEGVASWSYSVIPMFVLMGIAMWVSGVTGRAYGSARVWFRQLPGGLGITTNFAGAVLSSASGSTMGITMALTKMAVPEMLRAKYSPALATGSVTMAGTLGQLIPPSVLLVIYAGVAETPIGPQLLSGIVPGAIIAVAYCVVIAAWAVLVPTAAPRSERVTSTWAQQLRAVTQLLPVIAIMLPVLGGMYAGIFTATEAGAVGAVVSVLVSYFAQTRDGNGGRLGPLRFVATCVRESITSVAGIFLIVIGALMLTSAIARSGLATLVTEELIAWNLTRVQLLIVLILVYLVLGMFLESLPMILLTVPILAPALEAAGVDLVWFGVFIVIMCEIGMVFPPIGMLVFVVNRLVQEPRTNLGERITLTTQFRGVLPFVAAAAAILVLLIMWPDLVTWLPYRSDSGG
ncbi:TRAP transporter large permease [Pseudonocardia xishanensis]